MLDKGKKVTYEMVRGKRIVKDQYQYKPILNQTKIRKKFWLTLNGLWVPNYIISKLSTDKSGLFFCFMGSTVALKVKTQMRLTLTSISKHSYQFKCNSETCLIYHICNFLVSYDKKYFGLVMICRALIIIQTIRL